MPAHKTGTAFTKPVDPVLGQALDAWQAVRPAQPKFTDRRTGELVDLLFAFRARKVSTSYINNTVIPVLCRKAGVPAADVRGNITSHRARSTIASQLYNAKEPMTLFELQAWLGHRSPQSTQFYAKISPATLTRAYDDAGYFSRNMRTIEVLVDRDAVASGAAAAGEPWQHYDLGHGYCTYTFFEQCPHRMACAKCDFYTPKDSSKAQLLEAKENLQKMRAMIPLTEDEQAAVDDGNAALDRLLDRLADIPTPAGPTPRQLDPPASATLLPIIDVRQAQSKADLTILIPQNDLVDVAFDGAGAPVEGEPGGDGLLVAAQAVDEGAESRLTDGEGGGHPQLEQLPAAPLVHDDSQVADAGGHGGQVGRRSEDRVQAGPVGVVKPVWLGHDPGGHGTGFRPGRGRDGRVSAETIATGSSSSPRL